MASLSFVLAQGASLASSLIPLYYGVGILIPIIGGLWALRRYAANQREQNVQQGVKEGQLVDRLDANTVAANKNTASIEKLSEKFDSFASNIDKRLTLADYRLDKLEETVQNCKDNKNRGV